MLKNLKWIRELNDGVQIYCGHEYTVQCLEWAKRVEIGNKRIKEVLQWAIEERDKGNATVPSTIAREKEANVFLRWDSQEIKERTGSDE